MRAMYDWSHSVSANVPFNGPISFNYCWFNLDQSGKVSLAKKMPKKKKTKNQELQQKFEELNLQDKIYKVKLIKEKTGHRPQPLRAYLNVEEMKDLGLIACDPIMINGALGLSWPSRDVECGEIGVSPILYKNLDSRVQVTISKYEGKTTSCDFLQVHCLEYVDLKELSLDLLVKEALVDLEYAINGQLFVVAYGGIDYFFRISLPLDSTVYLIDRKTKVRVISGVLEKSNNVKFTDIGGLEKEIEEIKHFIQVCLFEPEIFTNHGNN